MAEEGGPATDTRGARRRVPLALFVSPHGFGHAARACAVAQAIADLEPGATFEVFSGVPEWFFAASLTRPFTYHPVRTDVGVAQTHPLVEDLEETLRLLGEFLPFGDDRLDAAARTLEERGCRLAICDISPLGLAVARRAAIPSVLVENFTWDWIYEPYARRLQGFSEPIAALAAAFDTATLRIQTEPVCRPEPRAVTVPPVSRTPRLDPREVRARLRLPEGVPTMLVSLGGIPWRPVSLRRLEEQRGAAFVVPGTADRAERRGSLVALPHRSGFYHPDLVRACDAVVGKLGYSTLAETYAAGRPFAFVPRPTFRESDSLAAFAEKQMAALALAAEELESGGWIDRVPEILARVPQRSPGENGAAAAAREVCTLLARA